MRRSTHPLAGLLRRLLLRDRRSEVGDTLIEILVTVTVLGGCAVALIITFGTAITASADHRNLVTNATVIRNIEQAAYYQLALQQNPSPLFTACTVGQDDTATLADYASINYGAPIHYSVAMPGIEYWNATTNAFVSTCPATNAPQLITLNVTNPNGSNAPTQFVVDGPGVPQTPFSVLSVSPLSASQGTSNLLLTITGTGFQSGDTVTFPTSLISETGPTTFVSPTTLNVFVNIAASPALTTPTGYAAKVAHLPPGASATGGSFTVIPVTPVGLHVSTMVGNIADPVVDDTDEDEFSGWDAWDTITVESGSGAPLAGVVVNGSWTVATIPGHILQGGLGSSTTTCTTDATGTCTVYYGWRDVLHYVSATFTVSPTVSTNPALGGLVLNGYTYVPGNNNPGALQIFAPNCPNGNGC